jgi:hypothetical protein
MNHKHTILTLILLTLSASLLTGQNKQNSKYDYIASGYYQLVYEADVAYLEGKDSLAFEKLQEAEKRCPLINQPASKEIDLYCRLLMKNRQFDKAISYMHTLANNYGMLSVNALIEIGKDDDLSKELLKKIPDFYRLKIPKLLEDLTWYYYSQKYDSAITILSDISASDQNVRMETENEPLNFEKMREADNVNYERIFQFIDKFGFPNTKLYGCANVKMQQKLDVLFMHIADHKDIADTILQFVREGQCEPALYGIVIDRKIITKSLREKGKPMYLYCPYSNIGDEEILDIENLDERRVAIGMPTRAMQQKRTELITKLYEQ